MARDDEDVVENLSRITLEGLMGKGWSNMDTDEKLQTIRSDLGQLFDKAEEQQRLIRKLTEYVETNLRSLYSRIEALETRTAHTVNAP
jgi:hypothetical protein